jgi:hypothetical protein
MDDVPPARKIRVSASLSCALWACALSIGALYSAVAEPPKVMPSGTPGGVPAGLPTGSPTVLTREDLIGVWRLVRIDYSGPHGTTVDPFYQADSTGLLIYDRSGWMSVAIVAPHRARFEVPSQRIAMQDGAELAALKVSAFDSYYAYDGTWEFNAATSEIAHHVASSLLAAESGVTYTQKVSLEGGHLIFTNRSVAQGEETIRLKTWERVGRH